MNTVGQKAAKEAAKTKKAADKAAKTKKEKKRALSKDTLKVVNQFEETNPLTAKELGKPLIRNISELLDSLACSEVEALKGLKCILTKVKALEKNKLPVRSNVQANYATWINKAVKDYREVVEFQQETAATIAAYQDEKSDYYVAYIATKNESTGQTLLQAGRAIRVKPCRDEKFLCKLITKYEITDKKREKNGYEAVTVCIQAHTCKAGEYTTTVYYYDIQADGSFTDNKGIHVRSVSNAKRGIGKAVDSIKAR